MLFKTESESQGVKKSPMFYWGILKHFAILEGDVPPFHAK